MENLKTRIQKRMLNKGANLDDFKFRFYKKSPYQKKIFKPEFVESECWIYSKKKKGLKYVITENEFLNVLYSDPFIDMILEENGTELISYGISPNDSEDVIVGKLLKFIGEQLSDEK